MLPKQRLAYLGVMAALAGIYFLAAKLGLSLAFRAEQVTPVWPPTGIALAAVVLFGYRVWPGIAIGAFAINFLKNEPLGTALGITAGNTLEALVAAWLLHGVVAFRPSLARLRDVLGLIIIAAAGSTMVSATIGVTSLCLGGVHQWSEFGNLWRIWWQGDVLGNLVMAPVLLCWLGRKRWHTKPIYLAEFALLLGAVIFFSLVVFAGKLTATRNEYPLEYIIFPFMIWAAFRFGQPGTTLITLVVSSIAIVGTVAGYGPFVRVHEDLMLLQSFLNVVAITGLLLAAAIAERNQEENARALDATVTQILAEASSIEEAAPRILKEIAQRLDWDAAILWQIAAHTKQVSCLSVWRREEAAIPEFVASCRNRSFNLEESLPGKILKSGRPEYLADIRAYPGFVRPAHEGLREAHSFPILLGQDVLGVLELFRTTGGAVESAYQPLVETLTSQIGQFMERKRTEQALRENEKRFRSLVEFSWEGIALFQADAQVIYSSPASMRDLGYRPEELVGHNGFEFVHPDDAPTVRRLWGELLQNPGGTVTTQYRLQHKKGGWHWMEATGTNLLAEPSVRAIVVNSRDITENRLVSEAKERLIAILEATTDFVGVTDLEGRLQYVNGAGRRILGLTDDEDPSNTTMANFHPDWARKLIMEEGIPTALRDGVWTGETALTARDVGEIPVSQVIVAHKTADGAPQFISTIARDVRSQKRLEEQFRQAQKMEAIGRLAGGVAHEFNNQMTVVLGYCQMILADMAPTDPMRESLEMVFKSGERAAAITRQLLAFGRKQMLAPRVLNLNDLVEDMDNMVRPLIGEDIELITHRDPALSLVKVDPVQIEQVLLNLVLNARDAMPRGGRLTITTANVVGNPETNGASEIPAGNYVLLTVADTGRGMDAAVKSHLFEPFFTTKPVGKGTGLGLAVAYGIVAQSGGHIEVDTEVNRGSTFRIYLPQSADAASRQPEAKKPDELPRGTETILFVEDEEGVRGLVVNVLESSGYQVLTASNGEGALKLCQHRREPIHLLITDVVMPQMSGRILADVLTATYRDLKVLFVSGHTDDMILRHGVCKASAAFLQKPFSPATLAQKIREVLDGTATKDRAPAMTSTQG